MPERAMLRFPGAVAILLSSLLGTTTAWAAAGPCPALVASDAEAPPRVMRFQASPGACPARGCYGLVLETARDGTPSRVLNLSTYRPDTVRDQLPVSPHVFELAAELWARHRRAPLWNDGDTSAYVEALPAERLARVVLSPVAIERDDLVSGRVVIVGAGLNYPEHAAEAGGGAVIFFPKSVIPSGAYGALADPGPQALLDYEAELAFVTLEPIDISSPDRVPPDDLLEGRIAWLAADDLTDRTSYVAQETPSPESGKSQPGFLPLGPWMVAGGALPLWSHGRGLRIQTEVRSPTGVRCAQRALTSDMQLSPAELLRALSKHVVMEGSLGRENVRVQGAARQFSLARRTPGGFDLPAGSVVLTGTPSGTAFGVTPKEPSFGQGVRAFFTFGSERELLLSQVLDERDDYGYLRAGDEVVIRVEHLGRQDLEITGSAP